MPTARSSRARSTASAAAEARRARRRAVLYRGRRGRRRSHVRGTVNGKVLVYSPERIVIVDDLRYAADPRDAGRRRLSRARRGAHRRDRRARGHGPRRPRGARFDLRAQPFRRSATTARAAAARWSIYGSVTAGSVSATEPRFATRIEFDDRLTTMRAPGFPLSDRYELDSSSGEWRVVDAP